MQLRFSSASAPAGTARLLATELTTQNVRNLTSHPRPLKNLASTPLWRARGSGGAPETTADHPWLQRLGAPEAAARQRQRRSALEQLYPKKSGPAQLARGAPPVLARHLGLGPPPNPDPERVRTRPPEAAPRHEDQLALRLWDTPVRLEHLEPGPIWRLRQQAVLDRDRVELITLLHLRRTFDAVVLSQDEVRMVAPRHRAPIAKRTIHGKPRRLRRRLERGRVAHAARDLSPNGLLARPRKHRTLARGRPRQTKGKRNAPFAKLDNALQKPEHGP